MNKNFSTALGLTLAIALTTGGVLIKHPPATGDKAPNQPVVLVQRYYCHWERCAL